MLRAIVVSILTLEAKLVLARFKPKIAAVTGSVGKTSTKDAIFTVLQNSFSTRKSEKSLNSEIGVPLAILGLETGWASPGRWLANIVRGLAAAFFSRQYPEWLILEVGTDRPGDITALARWLKPNIVVLTGIPDIPVHVERFSSPEALAQEKETLVRALRKNDALIFNGDDERSRQIASRFHGRAVSYGFSNENDFYATGEKIIYEDSKPTGMSFEARSKIGDVGAINIKRVLGKTQIYPVLASLAVGEALGLEILSTVGALASYKPPPGRMRIIEGVNGATIIDDSYNASPVATLAALDTLAGLKVRGRKIAALGDMRELGRYAKEAHRRVGQRAFEVVDILVCVGEESRVLREAAITAGLTENNTFQYGYRESTRAGKDLKKMLQPGDIVLVKGSQNLIRMEHLVKEIIAEPSRAEELLVRQEKEWLLR